MEDHLAVQHPLKWAQSGDKRKRTRDLGAISFYFQVMGRRCDRSGGFETRSRVKPQCSAQCTNSGHKVRYFPNVMAKNNSIKDMETPDNSPGESQYSL